MGSCGIVRDYVGAYSSRPCQWAIGLGPLPSGGYLGLQRTLDLIFEIPAPNIMRREEFGNARDTLLGGLLITTIFLCMYR